MVLVNLDSDITKVIVFCKDCDTGKTPDKMFKKTYTSFRDGQVILTDQYYCPNCTIECNECGQKERRADSYFCEAECGVRWCSEHGRQIYERNHGYYCDSCAENRLA